MTSSAGTSPPDRDWSASPAGAGEVHARRLFTVTRLVRLVAMVAVAIGLALLGSPHILRPVDRYQVGDFASRALRAPYDLSITDEQATRQQRDAAARNAPIVAALDTGVPGALRARFADAWKPAGTPLAEFAAAVAARGAQASNARTRAARAAEADRLRQREDAARRALDAALDEVAQRLGEPVPGELRSALATPGDVTRLVEAFGRLIADAYRSPVVADHDGLLALAAEGRPEGRPVPVVLVDVATGEETPVEDASRLRDLAVARQVVAARAPVLLADVPDPGVSWVTGLASRWLRPNAVPNATATQARREAAAGAVLPVSITFRRNQLIVGEGQPVTRQALLVLDAIRHQRMDRASWQRVAGRAGVILALMLLALVVVERERTRFAIDAGAVTYALTSLAATAVMFRLWIESLGGLAERYPALPEAALVLAFPASATVMHARVVLPYASAVTYLAVQSICLGLLWQLDLLYVVYLVVAGLVTSHLAARCSRRQCVLRAGLVGGLAIAPVAACLILLTGEASAAGVAWAMAAAVASCALSGLALLAVGPLFEWMFGHMTRIRLVELMNYQHPLLRRLTEVTPGTFQHSVTIGLLVDAAARAVDADALLARVGALYHDAGKTERPVLFVENQQAGENPHDRLTPLESARLIIDHVHAGVRLVGQFGLGERIADFVREHHGTSTVRFFQARAEALGPVDPDDFRYPGPRPRSRETGILMIADQVEAIARTMDAPTPEAFRAMVQQTIDRIQAEGQLDECPLTLQELAAIREAFVQVLVGAHHRRIKYPGQEPGALAADTPHAPPSRGQRLRAR